MTVIYEFSKYHKESSIVENAVFPIGGLVLFNFNMKIFYSTITAEQKSFPGNAVKKQYTARKLIYTVQNSTLQYTFYCTIYWLR
jgi:hypothetical protein